LRRNGDDYLETWLTSFVAANGRESLPYFEEKESANMSKTLLKELPKNSQKTTPVWENLTGESLIARYEKQFPELKALPRAEKIKQLLSRLKQRQSEGNL